MPRLQGHPAVGGRSRPAAAHESISRAAQRVAGRHGAADLVVARSLIEHSHDLPGLLRAFAEIVVPGGYLLIETPDTEPALDRFDPSVLWEEHSYYFTDTTLGTTLSRA